MWQHVTTARGTSFHTAMALMFPRKLRKAACKSAAEEDVFHGAEEQLTIHGCASTLRAG